MTKQLPAVIEPGRYVECFAANSSNDHPRRAYARACGRFLAWCETRGLMLAAIRPFDVAARVKGSAFTVSAGRGRSGSGKRELIGARGLLRSERIRYHAVQSRGHMTGT